MIKERPLIQILGHPSSYYEILPEYNSTIRHIDRSLFVCLSEIIAGECKIGDLFEWLEKLERSLIDF